MWDLCELSACYIWFAASQENLPGCQELSFIDKVNFQDMNAKMRTFSLLCRRIYVILELNSKFA